MAFENGNVAEEWRSAVVAPLYRGRKNIVDRVCRVTGYLIDDEQGEFRAGSGCIDQILTLNQIDEKACGFYKFGEGV